MSCIKATPVWVNKFGVEALTPNLPIFLLPFSSLTILASPSSTTSSDGLGPLYNARACQSCHIKDGRGHLPKEEKPLSAVLKVGNYDNKILLPNKIYGKQIQFFAIPGLSSESNLNINYIESNFRKNILDELNLKYPSYQLNNLKHSLCFFVQSP